jgi:hypothetical protein
VIGGTVSRMVEGEELAPATAPLAPERLVMDAKLARVHANLMMVLGSTFAGNQERAVDMLWLSQMACRDPNPGPSGAALERIGTLLDIAQRLFIDYPDSPRLAGPAIVLAMAIAATEVPQLTGRGA